VFSTFEQHKPNSSRPQLQL